MSLEKDIFVSFKVESGLGLSGMSCSEGSGPGMVCPQFSKPELAWGLLSEFGFCQ